MTKNRKFKKAVRARMAETGEKYTVARRAVLAERASGEAVEIARRVRADESRELASRN